jgi:hypothetical protein
MKFAVAVGVLAQTLPALSEQARDLLGPQSEDFRIRDVLRAARERGGSRANVQHRSMKRVLADKQRLDGQNAALKNPAAVLAFFATDQGPCDPASTDADVGVLSCGEGRFCKPTPESELGGLCNWKGRSSKDHSPGKHAFGGDGTLRNRMQAKKQEQAGIPCDPAMADIGILACGTGKFCRENKGSELGGICVSTAAASRHLYTVDKCDPSSESYDDVCDCSDLVDGTGTMTCIDGEYDFCEGVSPFVTSVYTFEDTVEMAYRFCYEFTVPYYQKLCLVNERDVMACSVEFNGEGCNSCMLDDQSYISSIDCTNVEGGGAGSLYENLVDLIPIISPCYGDQNATNNECTLCAEGDYIAYANYGLNVTSPELGEDFTCQDLALAESFNVIPDYACSPFAIAAQSGCCAYKCDLCGPDSYIPSASFDQQVDFPVEGDEVYTCGDFAYAAYVNFSIPEGTCAPVGDLMQATCCENGSSGCSICGGEMAYPDANVTLGTYEFPCFYLDLFLNGTECDTVATIAAPICCGDTSPGISMSPSGAPAPMDPTMPSMPTMPTEPAAPTATAGATMLLPATGIASVFGLALAAVVLVSTI